MTILRASAVRREIEAIRASEVQSDDGVTRTRQALEDLLAEMSYVLECHELVNDEADVGASWRNE
jgi:hypothetical protein